MTPTKADHPSTCRFRSLVEAVSFVPAVEINAVHARLGFAHPCPKPIDPPTLSQWNMQRDDAPILRWLMTQHAPTRHLEFGTWEGFGAKLVLEATNATVWSINLREGETSPDGQWAYAQVIDDTQGHATPTAWSNEATSRSGRPMYQTDALGFVGRQVHDAGLGHRLNQVYCDSRLWDTKAYGNDFFDSVLIDGGHQSEIVQCDTAKALGVTRPGGLVMWHDFCPDAETLMACESPRGVLEAVGEMQPMLDRELADLFWIKPSWLLVGVMR